MEKRTDDELIRSICQGNRDSFDPLAERYFPMLRRVAFRMIANREIAQDIAQEAMLQAYLSLRNLHNTERFESWLYGIVRNVCHNYLRSRQAQDDLWDELADSDNRMDEFLLRHNEMNLQQLIEDRELYGAVQEAMNALSPKNREAASVDPNLAFLAIFSRDCRDFGVMYSDFGYRKQPISYLKIAQI